MNQEQDNAIYTIIGHAIRVGRIKAGMKQEQLATTLGFTSRASISNIERGEQRPPIHVLYSIAIALNISLQDLIANLPNTCNAEKASREIVHINRELELQTENVMLRASLDKIKTIAEKFS